MQELPKEISDLIMGYLDYKFVIRYKYLLLVKEYLLKMGSHYERAYSLNRYKYLHFDDPARKAALGMPPGVNWTLDGLLHRYDGPAMVESYSNGRAKLEIYYQHGMIHRLGSPAYITYYEDGMPYRCWWGKNGCSTREDGRPTFEEYSIEGKLVKTSIFHDD